jgi:uncharacterized protein (DUF2267 family)
VEYKEFIQTVHERTGLSRQEAADLTRATLGCLAARLSGGEAVQLAMQLPDGLREYVATGTPNKQADRFGVDEFVRKVSEHTGLTLDETTHGVGAVLATLRDAVSDDEFDDVMAQLPTGFGALVQQAQRSAPPAGRPGVVGG